MPNMQFGLLQPPPSGGSATSLMNVTYKKVVSGLLLNLSVSVSLSPPLCLLLSVSLCPLHSTAVSVSLSVSLGIPSEVYMWARVESLLLDR